MNKRKDDLFGWLKKKDNKNDDIVKSKCKQLVDEFFDKTKKKSILLSVGEMKKNDDGDITRSKLGGKPYWPKDKTYPKDKLCLVQLNFNDLPNLDGFPSKGILQIFVDPKDVYLESEKCIGIYHENIVSKYDMMEITDDIHTSLNTDSEVFLNGVSSLSGKLVDQCNQYGTVGFDEEILPIYKKYFPDIECESIYDVKGIDCICDLIKDGRYGTRIGGYPSFTQSDPREGYSNIPELLVQLDCEGIFKWGDMVIANIFINQDKLINRRFSNLYFHWDFN